MSDGDGDGDGNGMQIWRWRWGWEWDGDGDGDGDGRFAAMASFHDMGVFATMFILCVCHRAGLVYSSMN